LTFDANAEGWQKRFFDRERLRPVQNHALIAVLRPVFRIFAEFEKNLKKSHFKPL